LPLWASRTRRRGTSLCSRSRKAPTSKRKCPAGIPRTSSSRTRKGAIFLLCALGETPIDLNAVSKVLGAGRFSFGSAERLKEYLGVEPGSVTLFALINDPDRKVTLVLDEALFAHDPVNFHPLKNDATTAISPADMLKFIRSLGREPIRLALTPQPVCPRDRRLELNRTPIQPMFRPEF
jgi:hypothetical protein